MNKASDRKIKAAPKTQQRSAIARTEGRPVKKFLTEEAAKGLSEASKKKRAQIVTAALDTFLDFGYEGATMNLVAERAGVIKQTIYSHFHDKEALFTTVIKTLTVDNVRDALNKPEMHDKPPDLVLTEIARIVYGRHQDPVYARFFRTMIGEAGRFPELARLYTEATIKPGLELVTSILRKQTKYHIEDPEAFARIFMGTIINHCMQQNLLYGRELLPFEFERLLKELNRLLEAQK